jgi:DNA-binding transcriptional LysR family regulator
MLWDERIGRRIKLKDLHTLQTIAQTGSMAKASSRLALSQPAISKAIADMEHTLGAPLLERSSRGVELTDCGRVLLERSRVIFDELRQGVRDIQHLSDPTQGEVRIGATPPMTVFVSEVIGTLSASCPGITYDITDSDTTRLVTLLRERELDVVISRWAGQASDEDLATEYLFDAPLAVLADRHNPLTRRGKLELGDLLEEKWVLPPADGYLGRIVTDIFARRNLPRPPVAVSTRSVYMQLNMVAGGRFLAMLPVRMVRYPANLAWLRALKIDLRDSADPVAAITLKNRRASGATNLFLQVSRQVAVPR